MGKHIKNERAKLMRRQAVALKELEKLSDDAAALVAEYRSATAGLAVLDTPAESRYLTIRSTKAAIVACLEFEERWMTKPEIADALFCGGFPMDPIYGKRLINDSINKGIMRGYLVEKNGVVGLPTWES